MKFKKGDLVKVKSNGREARVLEYVKEIPDYGPSKILAVLHYIHDNDPYSICFLGDDKLEIILELFKNEVYE